MAGRDAGCSTPQIHGIDATVVPLWCPSCLLAFGNLQKENDAMMQYDACLNSHFLERAIATVPPW